MDTLTRFALVLVAVGVFVCSAVQAQIEQSTAPSKVERRDLTRVARAQDLDAGKSDFESSCAPCHGVDGKGKGPLKDQLKVAPTDLTTLAKRNNGIFPFSAIYEFIDGRKLIPAHGTRDMPIWGKVYNQEALDRFLDPKALRSVDFSSFDPDSIVRARILSLIDYLNRIQEK